MVLAVASCRRSSSALNAVLALGALRMVDALAPNRKLLKLWRPFSMLGDTLTIKNVRELPPNVLRSSMVSLESR